MTPAARYAAAIDVLDGVLFGEPVEKQLSNWARRNRYAGSTDRAAVRDIVFDCLRNLRCYGFDAGFCTARGLIVGHCLTFGIEPDQVFSGEAYGPTPLLGDELQAIESQKKNADEAVIANLPDALFNTLKSDWPGSYSEIAQHLRTRAPVDIRVNKTRGTVSGAIKTLGREDIEAVPIDGVPFGLRVTKNARRIAATKSFADGLVELQDAASQSIVQMLDLHAAPSILDYCAGGGGKTLAMAALSPKSAIAAWDINPNRLEPLRERAKRAGAKVQILRAPPIGRVFDLVLVDAPCSGSGAWRRNPEGKWRITPESLAQLIAAQANVLSSASQHVAEDGLLVYVTCSIFHSENQAQLARFLTENSNYKCQTERYFKITQPGDGFYCAILQKQL
jgi:16S rRNA (cytosine967-C5)-methyltransferase